MNKSLTLSELLNYNKLDAAKYPVSNTLQHLKNKITTIGEKKKFSFTNSVVKLSNSSKLSIIPNAQYIPITLKSGSSAAPSPSSAAPSPSTAAAATTGSTITDTLNVLTYNVSWEAMTANTKDPHTGSAQKVADLCTEKSANKTGDNTNQCLINVAEVIENTPDDKTQLDFVGLQEATNWNIIRNKSNKLNKMKYIHHNIRDFTVPDNDNKATEDLVSFYNPDKFDFIAVKIGQLENRPFQLVYLEHKASKEIYLFINVHLPHAKKKKKINIDDILTNFKFASSSSYIYKKSDSTKDIGNLENLRIYNFINTTTAAAATAAAATAQAKKITDYNNNTNNMIFDINPYNDIYTTKHIIFLGDTNDKGNIKLYENFKPFEKMNTTTITHNVVKQNASAFKAINMRPITPLNTCCNSIATQIEKYKEENGNKGNIADYILISNTGLDYKDKKNPNKIPTFLTSKPKFGYFPTSDHLPVYATIKIPPAPAPGPGGPLLPVVVKPKQQFTIDNAKYETQQSLGCGRHALNNLFGTYYFTKDGDDINDSNIDKFVANHGTLSLQKLCNYLKIKLSIREEYCPPNENYDLLVLKTAVNILGYETNTFKQKNDGSYDGLNEEDRVGFLGNNGGAHWVAFRRISNDNYHYIDSLIYPPDNRALTLDNIKAHNFGKTLMEIKWNGKYNLDLIDTTNTADMAAYNFGIKKEELINKFTEIITYDNDDNKNLLEQISIIVKLAENIAALVQILSYFGNEDSKKHLKSCCTEKRGEIMALKANDAEVYKKFYTIISDCIDDNSRFFGNLFNGGGSLTKKLLKNSTKKKKYTKKHQIN